MKCKRRDNCKHYRNNSKTCQNNNSAIYYCGIAKRWDKRKDAWKSGKD